MSKKLMGGVERPDCPDPHPKYMDRCCLDVPGNKGPAWYPGCVVCPCWHYDQDLRAMGSSLQEELDPRK